MNKYLKLINSNNSLSISTLSLKNKLPSFVIHLLLMNDTIVLHNRKEYHKFFYFEEQDALKLVELKRNEKNNKKYINAINKKYTSKFGLGFYPTKENICIAYGFPSIYHEMAHIVEMINPKRWTLLDLGMTYQKAKSGEGLFAQITRECRVRAIQTFLEPQKHFSYPYDILAHSSFGELKKKQIGKLKCEKDIQNYFDDVRDRTIKAWSKDRVECEWKKRMTHIQNWQNTLL